MFQGGQRDEHIPMGPQETPPGLLDGVGLPHGFGPDGNNTFLKVAVVYCAIRMLNEMTKGLPGGYEFVREVLSMLELDDCEDAPAPSAPLDFGDNDRAYGPLGHLISLLGSVYIPILHRRRANDREGEQVYGGWDMAFERGILTVEDGDHVGPIRVHGVMERRFTNLRNARINALVGYVNGAARRASFSLQDLAETLAYHRHRGEGLLLVPPSMIGFADTFHNFRLWFLAIAYELKRQQHELQFRADVVFNTLQEYPEDGSSEDDE